MQRVSFCDGWEFARDGGPFEPVVVPHDAMLANRRDADAPAGSASGYYHGARYCYHKRFELTREQAQRTLLLEFEGVYRDAAITVNGAPVSAPPYGFIPFFADVTGLVQAGSNEIEVRASNAAQPDCRWYSGGGLHRPVWLWEGGAAHIAPEGVRVTTVSCEPATVRVDVTVEDARDGEREKDASDARAGFAGDLSVLVTLRDPTGAVIARSTAPVGEAQVFEIDEARLWDAEHPWLYACEAALLCRGDIADRASTAFGIRLLAWGPGGLRVNGREALLRGGCIHCDNGVIGAASFPESERRRIALLKQAGFNAVRVAHNPAPTALLDACDELGMYVMDETWDQWFTPKSAHDYARQFPDWCDHDLTRLVSRDFNHPSVIMYSIGNEVADPLLAQGIQLERSLVELLHALDPTRPVTCGLNLTMLVMERAGRGWYGQADGVAEAAQGDGAPRGSLLFNLAAQASGTGMTLLANAPGADKLVSPALDALDIAGYNYAAARYAVDARKHPQRVIVGSETFPHELAHNWQLVERLPNLVGDFMWAAWDYLGEAGAGAWAYTANEAGFSKPWPWLIAGSGALDILGQPNAHAALAAAVWKTADAPSIQVRPVNVMRGKTYKATWRGSDAIPSWSWAGCEGWPAQVEVYDGRAHAIRLELNGRVVGTARIRETVARFRTEYEPGTLRAVALDEQGREMARSELASAAGPLHVGLSAYGQPHAGDVAYVDVVLAGTNGQVESNADTLLEATVECGVLLGFGSARPATTERFHEGRYTTYRGRAQAIVYRSEPGEARITVSAPTLPSATLDISFA